jgi:hypothetical protein
MSSSVSVESTIWTSDILIDGAVKLRARDSHRIGPVRHRRQRLPTSPAITLERQSKLSRVSRPFAFGPAWKLEAVAFVTNLGICGFRHKTLSHCLKTVGQVLVGARCRKTQTRVSLVSKIRRALHRSPLRVTRTQ